MSGALLVFLASVTWTWFVVSCTASQYRGEHRAD